MKTQLPFLLFVLTFQLYIDVAITAPVEPVRTLDLPRAGTMLMNGEDSESEYTELQSTDIFNPTGLTGGDADFNADFKLAFDDEYLYLCAFINDDVEENYNWGVGNPWEFDNVEIFLQVDTNTVNTAYSESTVQLRFCRGLDSVQEPGHTSRSDYQYYCENTSTGWVLETAIPWTAVFQDGILPEDYLTHLCIIGFDFAGADSDDTDSDPAVGNRDCQSAWDSDDEGTAEYRAEDNAWNNTSVFGYLFTFNCGDEVPSSYQTGPCIYPNPAHDVIQIKNTQPCTYVEIFDVSGIQVLNNQLMNAGNNSTIDISSLKSGLYTMVVNRSETVRFVKE